MPFACWRRGGSEQLRASVSFGIKTIVIARLSRDWRLPWVKGYSHRVESLSAFPYSVAGGLFESQTQWEVQACKPRSYLQWIVATAVL